jgi:hypothetical protein
MAALVLSSNARPGSSAYLISSSRLSSAMSPASRPRSASGLAFARAHADDRMRVHLKERRWIRKADRPRDDVDANAAESRLLQQISERRGVAERVTQVDNRSQLALSNRLQVAE